MDFLSLGRGGGVARSPASMRSIFYGSSHNPGLFYLGPGKSLVCLVDGTNNPTTLVFDPTSSTTNVVENFSIDRGDRVSFKGAFATAEALQAVLSISPSGNAPGTGSAWPEDAVVTLPGGGSVRFVAQYNLVHTLASVCLDFTDGWYGAGWTEPPDYNPADLDIPAPPPNTVFFDPLLHDEDLEEDSGGGGEGSVAVGDGNGGSVIIKDGFGVTVAVMSSDT
jgi:hypothetical protein